MSQHSARQARTACNVTPFNCHRLIKPIGQKLGSLLRLPRTTARDLRRFFHIIVERRRLLAEAASGRPLRIVVGSSGIYEPGWIPTEMDYLNLLKPADWRRVFSENSLTAILAEHVWEHLTPEDGLLAALTCHNYLRPGAHLRLAVPDGFHPDRDYRDWVRPGGCGPGADDHKVLYTHVTLAAMLAQAGFMIELLEYFDATGHFHESRWDPADGMVHRSRRFDERNRGGALRYTSLVVDARKPIRSA
jgi:predicted SAM-dependent methyltransferase